MPHSLKWAGSMSNERLIEALAAYHQSISKEVPSGYIHFRIGMIEQELGGLNAALRAFNKALEIEEDLEDVYLERANVLCELNQHECAIFGLSESMDLRELRQ